MNDIKFVGMEQKDIDYTNATVKLNKLWATYTRISLGCLIESGRNCYWSKYSDIYPHEFKMISGYSYDKLTKVRSVFYQPKSWTEFIDYIMPKLNDTERKYIELLTDEMQGSSRYNMLSVKGYTDDIHSIALAISESTENKEKLSALFSLLYNRSLEDILKYNSP